MAVDEREWGRAVEKHAWENDTKEEKGEVKFHCKAKPGGWCEDLTLEQIMAPAEGVLHPSWPCT